MRGLHSKLPVSEPISIFSADSNKTLDSEIKTFIKSPFEIFDQISDPCSTESMILKHITLSQ